MPTSWAGVLRDLLEVALCVAGGLNLLLFARSRRAPAERRGFLLAASACLLFTAGLSAQSARVYPLALACAGFGAGFALGWFYHLYRQSLQNTTM
jgi:hypothetical protein